MDVASNEPRAGAAAFTVFLRLYAVALFVIFVPLLLGFTTKASVLAEHGGELNWSIWNDVQSGHDHAHVPPMLFVIYLTWAVFLLAASRRPAAYGSFLAFTMWANLAHASLMVVQAATDLDRYWSKYVTDIPFILGLSLGIYLFRSVWRPVAVIPEQTSL